MLSGTLISIVTYPIDTLKRIAQLNGGRAALKLYKSDVEIAMRARELGLSSMYRGIGPYTLSQILMSYTMFWAFEMFNFGSLGLK